MTNMVSRIFLLLRLLVKSGDSGFSLDMRMTKKRKATGKRRVFGQIGQILLIIFLLGYMAVMSFILGRSLARRAVEIGMEALLVPALLPALCISIVLFGFMFVVTAFYHTENNDILLSMPFRPAEIIAARYLQVITYLYMTVGIFFVPLFVAIGIYSGQHWSFYPAVLVLMLLIPFVALSAITIVIMILMCYTGLFKNKDRFTVISTIIVLLVTFLISFMYSMSPEDPAEAMSGVFANLSPDTFQTMGRVNWLFFGAQFAANWLANLTHWKGWINALLFVASAAIWFAVLLVVAQKVYFKGVMRGGSDKRNRKLTAKEVEGLSKHRGAFAAFRRNEIRVLLRTPAYLTNNVLSALLMPVFILIPTVVVSYKQGITISDIRNFTSIFSELDALNSMGPVALIIAVGCGAFLGGTNGITSASISREGSQAYRMKIYPYPFYKQIMAKFVAALMFSLIPLALLLIGAQIILQLPLSLFFPIMVLLFLMVVEINVLGLLTDLLMPKLAWSTEQQLAKQNWNMPIEIFGGFLLGGLAIAVLYLSMRAELSYWTCFALSGAFLLVCNVVLLALAVVASRRTLALIGE